MSQMKKTCFISSKAVKYLSLVLIGQVKSNNLPYPYNKDQHRILAVNQNHVLPGVVGDNANEICESFKLYWYGRDVINKLGTNCVCGTHNSGYNVSCQDTHAHCYNSACALYNANFKIEFDTTNEAVLTYRKECNTYVSGFNNTVICDLHDYTPNPDKVEMTVNNVECDDVSIVTCKELQNNFVIMGNEIDCKNLGYQEVMSTCDKSTLQGNGALHHFLSFDGTFTVGNTGTSSASTNSIATSLVLIMTFLGTVEFLTF